MSNNKCACGRWFNGFFFIQGKTHDGALLETAQHNYIGMILVSTVAFLLSAIPCSRMWNTFFKAKHWYQGAKTKVQSHREGVVYF